MLEAFHSQGFEAAQASKEQGEIRAAREAGEAARRKLLELGRESATEYGREAFARYGEAVRIGLDALLTRFCERQSLAGPHYEALPLLLHFADKGLGPIAAVALGAVIDSLSQRRGYRQLTAEIGKRVEAEVLAMRVEARGKDLLRLLKKQSGGRRSAVVGRERLQELRIRSDRWTAADRRAVGALLLGVIEAETGLVQINRALASPVAQPTEAGLDLIKANPPRPARVQRLPMLAPPRSWTGLYGGGHFTNDAPLVACRKPRDLAYLERADLSNALLVVNTLQQQEMTVDPWMVRVQREAWDAGIGSLFPVAREPLAEPPRPESNADRQAWQLWRERAAVAWRDQRTGRGKRVRIERALREMESVASRPVWFAYDLDFRGRIYSSNRYVTHQGPDREKAAICFSRGKPCGADSADWMLMAAAGHWGLSRVKWSERLAWGQANIERLKAIAEAPLDRLELWSQAKDPWQFLQLARAFAQWLERPTAPVGVPVRLDQTSSGQGILAALIRHRRIAQACNVIGDSPGDIYADVAERVQGMLRFDLEAGDPGAQRLAAFWLERGVDRQLAKGPVMTVTYGAAFPTLVDGFVELLLEEGKSVAAMDYEARLIKPSRYMARRMVAALREEVQPCLLVQQWLRDITGRVVKAQKPVEWTSPMGFPIRLAAQTPSSSKVETLLHGSASWPTLLDSPRAGELSARATNRSATANLVHSFDAAFAWAIVYRAAMQSRQLLTNHDCFAVCPADAGWLHKTLHDELRVMYQVDWLGEILQEIQSRTGLSGLPRPPMVNDLCPGEVGQNPYCFS